MSLEDMELLNELKLNDFKHQESSDEDPNEDLNEERNVDPNDAHDEEFNDQYTETEDLNKVSTDEKTNDVTVELVNEYFRNKYMGSTYISAIGSKHTDGRSVWYPVFVVNMSDERVETFRRFYSHVDLCYNNILVQNQDQFNLVCVC